MDMQETQLLAALDRMSKRVHAEVREAALARRLKLKSQPQNLAISSGATIQVYRPETVK